MVLYLYDDESQIDTSNLELELLSQLQTCLLSNRLYEISIQISKRHVRINTVHDKDTVFRSIHRNSVLCLQIYVLTISKLKLINNKTKINMAQTELL